MAGRATADRASDPRERTADPLSVGWAQPDRLEDVALPPRVAEPAYRMRVSSAWATPWIPCPQPGDDAPLTGMYKELKIFHPRAGCTWAQEVIHCRVCRVASVGARAY